MARNVLRTNPKRPKAFEITDGQWLELLAFPDPDRFLALVAGMNEPRRDGRRRYEDEDPQVDDEGADPEVGRELQEPEA